MIYKKSVSKLLSCAALCFASLIMVLSPATVSASWVTIGNLQGCVTYHKPVQKIGSKIYSQNKFDCRYSARKNQIKYTGFTHIIYAHPTSGGSRKFMGSSNTNRTSSLFIYKNTSGNCQNSVRAAIRNESYAFVTLTNNASYSSGKQANWRSFRTHNCFR